MSQFVKLATAVDQVEPEDEGALATVLALLPAVAVFERRAALREPCLYMWAGAELQVFGESVPSANGHQRRYGEQRV